MRMRPGRDSPSTMRTTSGSWPRGGMKSTTVTAPLGRLVAGLQHQGPVDVRRVATPRPVGGGEQPAAVVGRAESAAKQARRVEPGQAQPVDRAVAADEGDGVGVAEDGVALDRARHPTMVAAGAGSAAPADRL